MRKLVALAATALAALAFSIPAFSGAFPDGPSGPHIALVNQSTILRDSWLEQDLPYFQKYVDQVCDAWHCDGTLYITDAPKPSDWVINFVDVSSYDGALGWHAQQDGAIFGEVSVATSRFYNESWTGVATHELAEMLVDPEASASVNTENNCDFFTGICKNGTFYMKEIADPVQGEYYKLGPVEVSDFVYRSWFEPGSPGPYDAGRHLKAPLTLAPASYFMVYKNGQWRFRDTFDHFNHNWDSFGNR